MLGLRWRSLLLVISLGTPCLMGCVHGTGAAARVGERVSLVALIANPARWHGQRVRTEGVASISRGGSAVYVSREDARESVLLNGVSLTFVGVDEESMKSLNLKRVLVEGIFEGPEPGTLWSGSIADISLLYSLDDVIIE